MITSLIFCTREGSSLLYLVCSILCIRSKSVSEIDFTKSRSVREIRLDFSVQVITFYLSLWRKEGLGRVSKGLGRGIKAKIGLFWTYFSGDSDILLSLRRKEEDIILLPREPNERTL